jgi:hypothetical protein
VPLPSFFVPNFPTGHFLKKLGSGTHYPYQDKLPEIEQLLKAHAKNFLLPKCVKWSISKDLLGHKVIVIQDTLDAKNAVFINATCHKFISTEAITPHLLNPNVASTLTLDNLYSLDHKHLFGLLGSNKICDPHITVLRNLDLFSEKYSAKVLSRPAQIDIELFLKNATLCDLFNFQQATTSTLISLTLHSRGGSSDLSAKTVSLLLENPAIYKQFEAVSAQNIDFSLGNVHIIPFLDKLIFELDFQCLF